MLTGSVRVARHLESCAEAETFPLLHAETVNGEIAPRYRSMSIYLVGISGKLGSASLNTDPFGSLKLQPTAFPPRRKTESGKPCRAYFSGVCGGPLGLDRRSGAVGRSAAISPVFPEIQKDDRASWQLDKRGAGQRRQPENAQPRGGNAFTPANNFLVRPT